MTPEQTFARQVVSRCDPKKVGFIDPVTIGLVIEVLGLLVNCFRAWYELPPGSEIDKLREICKTPQGYQACLARSAKVLRHQARKSGNKLSRDGSFELAEKTLAEAINTPQSISNAYCSSVRTSEARTLAFLNEDSDEEEL